MGNYSESALGNYLKMVSIYPLLSKEEETKLFKQYRDGDLSAKEKIFNGNLRLVISITKKFCNTNNLSHLEMLDLIQEGNLKLIKAIETYDFDKGSFATYATAVISRSLQRIIDDTDDIIRKPVHLKLLSRKYNYLINKAYMTGKNLSDEEICDILGITEKTLKNIKNNQFGLLSLNDKISEEDSTEYEFFLAYDDSNFDLFNNSFDDNRLLKIIKATLRPLEYFIIYYHILSNNSVSLDYLAHELNINKEAVRQLEKKGLDKIKPYLKNEKATLNAYKRLFKIENSSSFNIIPITPKKIITYNFLKDILTNKEKALLKIIYFDDYIYSSDILAKKFKMNKHQFNIFYSALINKIDFYTSSSEYFKYAKKMISIYKTRIYKHSFNDAIFLEKDKLKNRYLGLTNQEINELLEDNNINLNKKQRKIINEAFPNSQKNITNKQIDKSLNILLLGYQSKYTLLPSNVLYPIYLNNKTKFTIDEQNYLECHFFKLRKDNKQNMGKLDALAIIYRLEKLYYHISQENLNFTKNQYLLVRNNCLNKLPKEQIEILDLYYGLSSFDSSSLNNEKYQSLYRYLNEIIGNVKKLFMQNCQTIIFDKDIYLPYLNNKKCHLLPIEVLIMKYYLIDNLDFEQIKQKVDHESNSIINIIQNAMYKIDLYRFNINHEEINIPNFKIFLNDNKKRYSDIEYNIAEMKYINCQSDEEILSSLTISKDELSKTINMIKEDFINYQINGVLIFQKDVLNECHYHLSESVLNEKEKMFIKHLYLDNMTYGKIREIMNLTKEEFSNIYNNVYAKIKARKLGIIRPKLLFISREKLKELFNNGNLPINNMQKEIISYLFEIGDYPYKTLEQLSNIYHMPVKNIEKIYFQAIIKIKKYQNHEIENKLNFDSDIKPLLKYFNSFDQNIIIDYFANQLSFDILCQKYGLSFLKLEKIIEEYKYNMFCFNNGLITNQFDFEYYQKICNNDDIPFYGNKDLAMQIFDLYYGMNGKKRLSISQIIEKLNLTISEKDVSTILEDYILSIYKYHDNIKKEKGFSYKDILDYFTKHQIEMTREKKNYYIQFLSRINNAYIDSTCYHISKDILFDLIKDKDPNYFSFTDLSRDTIIKILQNYGDKLSNEVREKLLRIYNINIDEVMQKSKLNELYKILNILDLKLKRTEFEKAKDGKSLVRKKIE